MARITSRGNHLHVNGAKPEEQGSFCDLSSHGHYDNVSKDGANEQIESAQRRGDSTSTEDVNQARPDDRFNLTLTEMDAVGLDHFTKLGPGK